MKQGFLLLCMSITLIAQSPTVEPPEHERLYFLRPVAFVCGTALSFFAHQQLSQKTSFWTTLISAILIESGVMIEGKEESTALTAFFSGVTAGGAASIIFKETRKPHKKTSWNKKPSRRRIQTMPVAQPTTNHVPVSYSELRRRREIHLKKYLGKIFFGGKKTKIEELRLLHQQGNDQQFWNIAACKTLCGDVGLPYAQRSE